MSPVWEVTARDVSMLAAVALTHAGGAIAAWSVHFAVH
jgi:hypothetical protein